MRDKKGFDIIEMIYSGLLLLVVGLYVLWLEFETSLGAPPPWLLTAVTVMLIPAGILLLKECVIFLANLLRKGEPDA